MSAVLHSIDAAREARIDRGRKRAKSKAAAFGYCRVMQITMAHQVGELMEFEGVSEDDAIARIVKPKSSPHFDPPTRPAA